MAGKGHQTVGAIADELIQGSNAETKVKALLGTETLSHPSTWPDEVKHGPFTAETKAYAGRNPHHGTNHFADIPIQSTLCCGNEFKRIARLAAVRVACAPAEFRFLAPLLLLSQTT